MPELPEIVPESIVGPNFHITETELAKLKRNDRDGTKQTRLERFHEVLNRDHGDRILNSMCKKISSTKHYWRKLELCMLFLEINGR